MSYIISEKLHREVWSTLSRLAYMCHYILSSIKVRTICNVTMKLTAVDIRKLYIRGRERGRAQDLT